MNVYYDPDLVQPVARVYPYGAADATQAGYVDLVRHPERIETCLEDFRPHGGRPAIREFYDFLRWINGPDSELQTCDCGMREPNSHEDPNSSLSLRVQARLYILFRHLPFNCSPDNVDWLCSTMSSVLEDVDREFSAEHGVVGFTKQPALHSALSQGRWLPDGGIDVAADDPGHGRHVMLTFFAYGNSEEEAFDSFARAIRNVRQATRRISESIRGQDGERSSPGAIPDSKR